MGIESIDSESEQKAQQSRKEQTMKKLSRDLALVAVSPEAEQLLPLPPERIGVDRKLRPAARRRLAPQISGTGGGNG